MLALEPASRPGTHDLAAQLQRCSPEARSVRRTRVALATAFILILGVSASFIFLLLRTQNSLSNLGAPDKSIAVLPFENLSNDQENAYFADGVQDEILTDLAKIADLKVISRTSVMQYKSGVARNLREIGQQLGVAHVVEGSVQRAGNKVRVNAQLIDARTDGTSGRKPTTAIWPMCSRFKVRSRRRSPTNCRPTFRHAKRLPLSKPPQMISPPSNSTLEPKIFLRAGMRKRICWRRLIC